MPFPYFEYSVLPSPIAAPKSARPSSRHHNRCYCREQGQNQRHALPVFTAKSSHKSRRNYYDSQHTPRVAGMKAAFVIRYRSIFILIAPLFIFKLHSIILKSDDARNLLSGFYNTQIPSFMVQ